MDTLINKIHFADCLDILRRLPDGSVDLFLQDPPYGVTQNKWDNMPDFDIFWSEWKRVGKESAAFVFTGMQPFTSYLILSQKNLFKYEVIWEKSISTGFLNAKKQPLRKHENILVFYKNQATYNPQIGYSSIPSYKKTFRAGKEVSQHKGCYGRFNAVNSGSTDGSRYPTSIIHFKGDKEFFSTSDKDQTLHPTQKPVDLFRYLIKTYSNPGDVIFDGYGGSGTTAIAAQMENRKFIVCENNFDYFEASQKRLADLVSAPYLFSDLG